jgi:rhodanese-related sulfurtransferase
VRAAPGSGFEASVRVPASRRACGRYGVSASSPTLARFLRSFPTAARMSRAHRRDEHRTREPGKDPLMKVRNSLLIAFVSVAACAVSVEASAQSAAPAAAAPQPWKYHTRQLDRAQIDRLLANPSKVLFLDVRRPDEVTAKGSWPVYLSVQVKDVEKYLDFLPRDRAIVTVSNHAHRAGAVGDLLASKGFQIAGAAGSEDYEAQGGTITRIPVPPPSTAAR